jgi:hypothetical protein
LKFGIESATYAHVADAINKPYNHPDGTDAHGPFWTTDEERGVIINFRRAKEVGQGCVSARGMTLMWTHTW